VILLEAFFADILGRCKNQNGTMISTLLDLGKSIARYPALHGTLGKKWIQAEGATDPVESRFTLARWLRIPECAEVLKHFRLRQRPGWNARAANEEAPGAMSGAFAFAAELLW
jgi:hypothetical protein